MKLSQVKFHNSVKVGREEKNYVNETGYNMVLLSNGMILVEEKGNTKDQVTVSSIFNTVYAVASKEEMVKAGLFGHKPSDETPERVGTKGKQKPN